MLGPSKIMKVQSVKNKGTVFTFKIYQEKPNNEII